MLVHRDERGRLAPKPPMEQERFYGEFMPADDDRFDELRDSWILLGRTLREHGDRMMVRLVVTLNHEAGSCLFRQEPDRWRKAAGRIMAATDPIGRDRMRNAYRARALAYWIEDTNGVRAEPLDRTGFRARDFVWTPPQRQEVEPKAPEGAPDAGVEHSFRSVWAPAGSIDFGCSWRSFERPADRTVEARLVFIVVPRERQDKARTVRTYELPHWNPGHGADAFNALDEGQQRIFIEASRRNELRWFVELRDGSYPPRIARD